MQPLLSSCFLNPLQQNTLSFFANNHPTKSLHNTQTTTMHYKACKDVSLLLSENLRSYSKMKRTRSTRLYLKNESGTKQSKSKGVYSRPSAAIEKGSGFYVPGLEGSRVRGLFGLVILILTAVNYFSLTGSDTNEVVSTNSAMTISQIISISYGILLILQGLVEFGKEYGFTLSKSDINDKVENEETYDDNITSFAPEKEMKTRDTMREIKKTVNQYASPLLLSTNSSHFINNLQWTAASFVSLTPATHILLIKTSTDFTTDATQSILYTLGDFSNSPLLSFNGKNSSDEKINSAISNAIETVYNSKGGRVSIPSDHPGSNLVPEFYRRCILLQKLSFHSASNDKYCLVVSSNQLLAAFTKNDLKWLGRLAKYIEISFDN